ncbi:MAG: pyruvate formate-lyase-activating protein [Eubacteriales bacterium]
MQHTLKLSSYQSLGACDGPSLRTVLFLYGCPLRCDYCHNPETWTGEEFQEETIENLVKKIQRNKPYFKNNGGVTVSGGEPLLQQEGILTLFQALNEEGIHCCIDTSACVEPTTELLALTDLFLLDIKFLSGEEYKEYTGQDIFPSVLQFLNRTQEAQKPLWIRHVLYPNVTDHQDYIKKLLDFTQQYNHIQRLDLLPFKNICSTKYDSMNLEFKMKDTPLTHTDTVERLKSLVAEVYPR